MSGEAGRRSVVWRQRSSPELPVSVKRECHFSQRRSYARTCAPTPRRASQPEGKCSRRPWSRRSMPRARSRSSITCPQTFGRRGEPARSATRRSSSLCSSKPAGRPYAAISSPWASHLAGPRSSRPGGPSGRLCGLWRSPGAGTLRRAGRCRRRWRRSSRSASWRCCGSSATRSAPAGCVRLCIDAIAARAGVCRRLAQNAIRQAARLGLLTIQERRREGQKNLPNVVRGCQPRMAGVAAVRSAPHGCESGERGHSARHAYRVQKYSPHGQQVRKRRRAFGAKGCRDRRGGEVRGRSASPARTWRVITSPWRAEARPVVPARAKRPPSPRRERLGTPQVYPTQPGAYGPTSGSPGMGGGGSQCSPPLEERLRPRLS